MGIYAFRSSLELRVFRQGKTSDMYDMNSEAWLPVLRVQMGSALMMKLQLHEEIESILSAAFWAPFRQLMRDRPRKEFIRPVVPTVREGRHGYTVSWVALLPIGKMTGDKYSGNKLYPLRLSNRKGDWSPKLRGVANVTPEMIELIDDVVTELKGCWSLSDGLTKTGKSISMFAFRLGYKTGEFEWTEDEMRAASLGYNPGSINEMRLYHSEVPPIEGGYTPPSLGSSLGDDDLQLLEDDPLVDDPKAMRSILDTLAPRS